MALQTYTFTTCTLGYVYLLFGACTGVLYFGERGEVDTDSAIVFLSSGRRVEVESVFEAVLMCVSILRG